MNKTAIKNFAIWARNKLIADISYKAGLMGITEDGVKSALPQSTKDVEFYDIGTKEPYSITGKAIAQRRKLAELIGQKAKASDYQAAYRGVIEEVAYTWFNRLIAIRFMEVNDYLPSRIRVLSSESGTKLEPDLVTTPFDADLRLSDYEQSEVLRLKNENEVDELFQMLFIRQCNELNKILPKLFETTADYTELLLNVSVTDQDGVVCRLVHDIPEDDFNVEKGGQVEIIGWLYQYYNTEPKDEAFALLKKNVKITKERIPAATQLFTPDWIVRYMVENSLGRLWIEHEIAGQLSDVTVGELQGIKISDLQRRRLGPVTEGQLAKKYGWKYYLEEAQQEADVQAQLMKSREEYKTIRPEDIKVIDPCMGSGHILVYAFDVLMQIYESAGYTQRDAAKSILEHNLYGIDLDVRAFQLAYFAVMMKARQYNRRILDGKIEPNLSHTQQISHLFFDSSLKSNNDFVALLDDCELAERMGSLMIPGGYNTDALLAHMKNIGLDDPMQIGIFEEENLSATLEMIKRNNYLAQKYDVVITNPPYMGNGSMDSPLSDFVKKYYPDSKSDLFAVFIERCLRMSKSNGYTAMITQHAWMFLSSFEKLRAKLLKSTDIVNMAHLGARAFDEIGGEVVQTTSFALRKSHIKNYKGVYCRLIEPTTQKGKEDMFLAGENRYESEQDNFSKIPGKLVVYWLSDAFIDQFADGTLSNIAVSREGVTSGCNDLFLRLWHEVPINNVNWFSNCNEPFQFASRKKWYTHNKGGEFRRWYGNREYVIDWENNGYRIQHFYDNATGRVKSHNYNLDYNFREMLTWSNISSGLFSLRYVEPGFIFDTTSSAMFLNHNIVFTVLAFMNSCVAQAYLDLLCPMLKFQPGNVIKVPFFIGNDENISNIAKNCINTSRFDWDSFETSWDFTRHSLVRAGSVAEAYAQWEQECADRFNTLKSNEEELNRIFIDIYGLQDELTPEVEDKDVTVRKADLGRDVRSLISYAVGCMFGRYSLDVPGFTYAGGEWDESKYSTFIPDKDNILPITDEEYFEDDIVGLFCAWLKKVYGADTLEENLDFIAKALGNKGNTSREVIRNYFLNDFFKDHCKIYQKRPIYWLFDSGKQNGFKALIYMHRYDENTIGNLRIDYLHHMERVYDSEIARMQDVIDNSTAAREVTAATKRKEKLQKQVKECKEYDEKIAHLALARIKIDLDDGVKVNYEKVQTVDGKKYPVLANI